MQTGSEIAGLDNGFDTLDYHYTDSPSISRLEVQQGEKGLWCAVIHQAFIDMCPHYFIGKGLPLESDFQKIHPLELLNCARKERREAAHWLLYDRQDFDQVCALAGVSPAVIRRAARRFIAA